MTRKEVLAELMKEVKEDDIIIASTGMVSRDLYLVKDRPLNFYMLGSMGNALAIGLGLALNTNRRVIVINGDGSALMSLGTMVTHKKLGPKNLRHIILDNNEHSSTGGQFTASDCIDFESLAPDTFTFVVESGKGYSPRIPLTCKEIKTRFMEAFKNEKRS
jgi:thiamine pyrophosphate-dependent acetolactate synthase large subunit-like protein